MRGPTAAAVGELDGNLVLKAARALAERVPGLQLGQFALAKRLPVAAGLGGGSAMRQRRCAYWPTPIASRPATRA